MAIATTCPHCRSSYRLADQVAGQKVRCKNCQKAFVVPAAAAPKKPVEEPLTVEAVEPAGREAERFRPAEDSRRQPRAQMANRPRPRAKGSAAPVTKSRSLVLLLVGGGVAALLLLAGIGVVAAWMLWSLPSAPPQAGDPLADDAAAKIPDQPVAGEPRHAGLPAGDGIPAKNLEELKAATVFVKVEAGPLKGSGSGFVMKVDGDTGLIVTNHHVVHPEVTVTIPMSPPRLRPPRGTIPSPFVNRPPLVVPEQRLVLSAPNPVVTLVFRSGTRKEESARAELVATDSDRDLAVLKVTGVKDLPKPIDFGQVPRLVETMPLYVFGFPFGSALSTNKGNPAITVGKASISSLRLDDRDELAAVQIDGALNPGNSGGPVVDAEGRLVGVAVATIKGSGIGLAIPAGELTKMLDGRVGATGFTTKHVNGGAAEVGVEVRLIDPLNQVKAVAIHYLRADALKGNPVRNRDGSWSELSGSQHVDLTVERQKAAATFTVWSAEKTNLSFWFQTSYVNGRGKRVYTQPSPFQVNFGPPAGVAALPPQPAVPQPALPQPFPTPAPQGPGPQQPARPLVIQPPNPVEIKAPTLGQEKVVKQLPAPVRDVVVGGGGRYLILHLPTLRKLAVFDASAAAIVNYVPLTDDDVRFAASMDKLLVLLRPSNTLQRWDLKTCKREAAVPMPVPGEINQITMGSASNGPLLVTTGSGATLNLAVGSALLDIQTLKPLEVRRAPNAGMAYDEVFVRASADGTVFATWNPKLSPQGLHTFALVGGELKQYYQHDSFGHLLPGPDGRVIFTARGLYTLEGKPLDEGSRHASPYCLPATHGNYYLRFRRNPAARLRLPGAPPAGESTTAEVYLLGDARPLATIPQLEVGEAINGWDREAFGVDKHIHFIPDAKLLITIPATHDRLLLHRFDVEQALEKSGIDYLLVTSRPLVQAMKGKTYSYQLAVKSKKGGIQYRLDSAPTGMKISEGGKITWSVPANFAEAESAVIVSIRNNTGQEVFHTFKVSIRQ